MVMAVSANNNDNNNNNQEATASQKSPSTANGVPVNSTNNGVSSNTNNLSTGDAVNSKTQSSLRHDPGISVEWTPDEQSILDDLLSKYASESNLVRYAKIAMKLKDKTVRDVALRCRWMTKQSANRTLWNLVPDVVGGILEQCNILTCTPCLVAVGYYGDWSSGKGLDLGCVLRLVSLFNGFHSSTKKRKMAREGKKNIQQGKIRIERVLIVGKVSAIDMCLRRSIALYVKCVCGIIVIKRVMIALCSAIEKATDSSTKSSSHLTTRPNGPSYAPPIIPIDNDDGVSYKDNLSFADIGGETGELLEKNAQILSQISSNFASFQVMYRYLNLISANQAMIAEMIPSCCLSDPHNMMLGVTRDKFTIHDNISLLCKSRENILALLNDKFCSLNDMPETMEQMPRLPVNLNEELASNILPPPSH
ncbi:unnamed protein product [Dovyalis caffra]|uniref:Myb-like domain-containing protein n=1 Tax=Dovyalis caffra TaxID=77055 RepID=A0AAV1SCL4_9ROSI|nr:unnamed protein product [Dovyalis caffra]